MPSEADNTLTLRSQHFPLQHQRGTDHVNTEHITSKQKTSCLYPLTPSSLSFQTPAFTLQIGPVVVILFFYSTRLGKPCSGCWGHVFFVPRRRNSSECICEYYLTEHARNVQKHIKYNMHLGTDVHVFHILKSEINICRKVGAGGFIHYQDVPPVEWDHIFKEGLDWHSATSERVCVISWQMRLREACDSEENTYANLISRKTRCEMFAKDNRVICITSWGFIQRANC